MILVSLAAALALIAAFALWHRVETGRHEQAMWQHVRPSRPAAPRTLWSDHPGDIRHQRSGHSASEMATLYPDHDWIEVTCIGDTERGYLPGWPRDPSVAERR